MADILWHSRSYHDALHTLDVHLEKGLSDAEVARRRVKYGDNAFTREHRETVVERTLKQFKSPLVWVLLLAGIVTVFLAEYTNATVVFAALIINVAIGTFQEARASRAFEKLSASQEERAVVLRGGARAIVPARELVPGDIVLLASGSAVPADVRLCESHGLAVNEAPLTGEWLPVDKDTELLPHKTPLAERANMVWMGTLVVAGSGRGVVVRTGGATELGIIAESLQGVREAETPIQKSIKKLAVFLSYLVLIIVTVIFVLGTVRGNPIDEMLLLAVAVAVSVIPEGLPAAVTAVLAIGMEKILERKGLVRNLLAAETLGSTTVIFTDKTGTITEAKMRLAGVYTRDGEVRGREMLETALLTTEALVEHRGDGDALTVRGRPMELALLEAGVEQGVTLTSLQDGRERLDTLPFESENRFAAALYERGASRELAVAGAPDLLLASAERFSAEGETRDITDDDRAYFRRVLHEGGMEGKRFLAVGYKRVSWDAIPEVTSATEVRGVLDGLVFDGLLSFTDPIREDVPAAIARAKSAGARVIMLTGDSKETAHSIAVAAGIAGEDTEVYEGGTLEALSDEELLEKLLSAKVFARVLPTQKLRLVKVLQKSGEVVAMTGDGINDAPALRHADIGIAVESGTEVAKEASDLVLLNDSFSIIVAAIEEGRRIMDNLKKVVTHLFSTSFHEVFLVATAILGGFPLPVLPVQILWVNIISEGLLNFAFAFEPAERDVMRRNPRSSTARTVLTGEVRTLIFIAGLVTSVFSVALYFFLLFVVTLPIEEIRTVMFVVLTFDAIFFAVSLKHLRKPFWNANFLTNRYFIVALGTNTLVLLAALTIPALRSLLSLTALSGTDLLILLGVAAFNLLTIESAKVIAFRKKS
ncbi:HAD-IC family P-type ATPase [Candidatus Wolfebacteria bacterium]|nr:HAD-IC family P-type ATPase [Candidatus Wolfebacteria bacterium]